MTSARGPRLEFAVGAFLLLALASLLVLAVASTNCQFGFARGGTYELTARFTNLGQLRPNAPVKIGGVTIGRVTRVATWSRCSRARRSRSPRRRSI